MVTSRVSKVPCTRLAQRLRRYVPVKFSPPRLQSFRVAAKGQGENSESMSRQLTEQEAREILGVSEGTSFDQIVKIKNKLLSENLPEERRNDIQGAYDLLLMKSMNRRVRASDEIPSDVRYADVKRLNLTKEAKKMISKFPTGGVAIEQPSADVVRINSIVYGLIAIYILPEGFNETTLQFDAVPGVQLAFAFAWSIYSYRQYKLLAFGRSFGYALGGLVGGAMIGGALEGLLHVHEHPLGGFHSPAALISEFAVFGMWTCAIFLS